MLNRQFNSHENVKIYRAGYSRIVRRSHFDSRMNVDVSLNIP